MAVDPDKLNAFLGKFVADFGAAFNAGMVVIGEDLGLYKALAGGAMTSKELAAKTATDERYVREWLSSQAAGGYVEYNPLTRSFSLTPEQSFALAEEGSPAYLPGAFQVALAALKAVPRITEAFRSGAGVGWDEHDPGLFHGTESSSGPATSPTSSTHWIPALDGVEDKTRGRREGGRRRLRPRRLDDPHGAGLSEVDVLGLRLPPRRPSTTRARPRGPQGVPSRACASRSRRPRPSRDGTTTSSPSSTACTTWATRSAPRGHVRESLRDDGTWMIVEPFAHDDLEQNLNPVGRVFYGASTLICTPASRAQDGACCLGAQAGERRLREVVTSGGFSRFRRATETPFNLVFEARP